LFALLLARRDYMHSEHTHSMEGLLTHVATADCFTTTPHPALACGIVTAWWRFQVATDTPTPGHRENAQGRHSAGEQIT
jgi:hypothetical protein